MSKLPPIGPHVSDEELDQFGMIVADAFAVAPDRSPAYFESVGPENIRVARASGAVIGGLVLLPKGQWFGGRSVPMTGLAAVVTAPESRARGTATALLKSALVEMHESRTPISTLYPATLALYRRVGYEAAGLDFEVTIPTKSIDVRDRTLEMRAARDEDEPQIRAVYSQYARRTAGNLDRSEFNWRRVHQVRDEETRGYVICRDGEIEGYAYTLTKAVAPIHADSQPDVRVQDMAALTPEAARRLLTFLADHRTVRRNVVFLSSPSDPLLLHLAEERYSLRGRTPWMLRIVHVVAALEARGYPAGMSAEVHFNVRDELLPANNGRFVLQVADGAGRVQPGGRGAVDVDVRGLAAMYTGCQTPQNVALAGLGSGPEPDLAAAAAVFAGPIPWMRDDF